MLNAILLKLFDKIDKDLYFEPNIYLKVVYKKSEYLSTRCYFVTFSVNFVYLLKSNINWSVDFTRLVFINMRIEIKKTYQWIIQMPWQCHYKTQQNKVIQCQLH